MAYRKIPFAGVRKAISQRLRPGFHEALPVALMIEYNADELLEHRNKFNNKISFTAYGVKAVALSLKEFPDMNVTLEGEELVYHEDINIAVAVHTPKGLRAPVIRDADKKSLIEITEVINEFSEKGKRGEITLADQTGHSFTVTNLGMMGVTYFTPIINPPDTAILALGTIKQQPTLVNLEWKVRNIGYLTLVFDHRVIDGVPAAIFLNIVKKILEKPYDL
ncbi:MAG: dihydrolipoamide acetyltransferase family protein [Nitrososphaerota archaeon]|nr:dihydrolipoamide acetyltransferase family protein [Nitrososphaerota archaeon]